MLDPYRIDSWFAHCVCRFGECPGMEAAIASLESRMRALDEKTCGERARQAVFSALRECSKMDPSFEELIRLAEEALARVEKEMEHLSIDEVMAIAGCKKTFIYAGIKAGTFPAPASARRGRKKALWRASDIYAWKRERDGARAER